jgi:hypothetical protein
MGFNLAMGHPVWIFWCRFCLSLLHKLVVITMIIIIFAYRLRLHHTTSSRPPIQMTRQHISVDGEREEVALKEDYGRETRH